MGLRLHARAKGGRGAPPLKGGWSCVSYFQNIKITLKAKLAKNAEVNKSTTNIHGLYSYRS